MYEIGPRPPLQLCLHSLPPVLHSASLEFLQVREHAKLNPATCPIPCRFLCQEHCFSRSLHCHVLIWIFSPEISPPDLEPKWSYFSCSLYEKCHRVLTTHSLSPYSAFFFFQALKASWHTDIGFCFVLLILIFIFWILLFLIRVHILWGQGPFCIHLFPQCLSSAKYTIGA